MEVTIDVTQRSSPSTRNNTELIEEKKSGPTIQQLIEQKEKAKGTKRPKLFDYDDEW